MMPVYSVYMYHVRGGGVCCMHLVCYGGPGVLHASGIIQSKHLHHLQSLPHVFSQCQ